MWSPAAQTTVEIPTNSASAAAADNGAFHLGRRYATRSHSTVAALVAFCPIRPIGKVTEVIGKIGEHLQQDDRQKTACKQGGEARLFSDLLQPPMPHP